MRIQIIIGSVFFLGSGCATPEDPAPAYGAGGGLGTGGATETGGATGLGGATGAGGVTGTLGGATGLGGVTGTLGGATGLGGYVTANCTNEKKDGLETDVDCGGTCVKKCELGKGCLLPKDCVSNACTNSVCSHCGDKVQNGDETGLDCGGTCAGCVGDPCSTTDPCAAPGGCGADGICTLCANGVKDTGETGTDCEGSCPLKCTGSACTAPEECLSGDCEAATGKCKARSCVEGWATATKASTGASTYLCADSDQQGDPNYQGDRAGCATILDCLITNAPECPTLTDCLSENGQNGKKCDATKENPARDIARATYTAMCK